MRITVFVALMFSARTGTGAMPWRQLPGRSRFRRLAAGSKSLSQSSRVGIDDRIGDSKDAPNIGRFHAAGSTARDL